MRPPYERMKMTENENGFEENLKELEAIVNRLEGADQPLEESLRDFERGIQLARQCSHALNNMQLRIERLTVSAEGEVLREPFDPQEPTADGEGGEPE